MQIFKSKDLADIRNPGYLKSGDVLLKLPYEFVESDGFEKIINEIVPGKYTRRKAEIKSVVGEDLNGKKILVMRRGGFGDILWISRIIRKLKEKYPDAMFVVATHPRHHMIFDNNPDVLRCVQYPIPIEAYNESDYQIVFEHIIERERSEHSVYDLFAQVAGIELDQSEKIPVYDVPPGFRKQAAKWLKRLGIPAKTPKVMIHMGASTPWKSWPPQHIFALADTLARSGYAVFLAGNKNVFPFEIPNMKNVFQLCYRTLPNGARADFWPIEYTLALMTKMNLFIGPDSGLVHFSAALNVRSIAIYGPFPAKAYVSTYPKCIPIENRIACQKAPCFPHLDNRCTEMVDRRGHSKCLYSITPEMLIPMIEDICQKKVNAQVTRVEIVEKKVGDNLCAITS